MYNVVLNYLPSVVFTTSTNESIVKEDSRQATSAEFQKASKFAASKGMKLFAEFYFEI